MNKSKSLITVTAIGALAAAGLAAAAPASGAVSHRQIPRTKPSWVSHTKSLGRAPASGTSSFRVYLAPHGGLDALKAEVDKLSNPASASYAHWLSASQYHARYDATSAEAGQVTSWLKSQHLTVSSVEAHRRYVQVTGSNAATEKAFGTTLNRYRHNGQTVQANASAVTVPSSIASLVTTVTGLDTTPRIIKHKTTFPAGFRNARPCSSYYGEKTADKKGDGSALPKYKNHYLPYAVCGYTGTQLRPAYEGAANPLTGANVTVAITDAYASPTMASDAQRYATDNGDKAYTRGQYREVLPKSYTRKQTCGYNGWWGEEALDVESVHAMAPDANILYYGSASCFDKDFLNTLAKVVDDNTASLVTNSWSDLEANESPSTTAAYQQIFLQGASQGIGFMFSSGDDGDELDATGTKQANYPASDPYATAVGGTSDAIGATGQFLFQTGWGTNKYSLSSDGQSWNPLGFLYGAGGGYSSLFPKPYYQAGAVSDSTTTMRAVPDVGLDADPTTGFLVGQTQAFPEGDHYDVYRIGGTSLASPMMAGLTALTTQNAQHRLGFLNPLIYRNQNSGAFADVNGNPGDAGNVRADFANGLDASGGILYSVRTFNEDSSLTTGPGWDDVTGVGSPHSGWTTAH